MMCLFKVVMIIDECQEKMNCLYSLVNVSSVITDLSIFIAGGGGRSFGGNKWFSGGMEGLSGILIQPPTRIISRRFSMLVHLLIKFVNKLSNMIEVVEFITSNMQTIITQYLVTVDLFFSNICRGVFGIPCTRLRHNCVVN